MRAHKTTWNPPLANQEIENYLAQLPQKLEDIKQQPFRHNLTQGETKAITSLAHNTDLVIRKEDKGSCTVVKDREQYIKDGLDHLKDELVYRELTEDPTAALVRAIHNYVDSLGRRYPNKDNNARLPEIRTSTVASSTSSIS